MDAIQNGLNRSVADALFGAQTQRQQHPRYAWRVSASLGGLGRCGSEHKINFLASTWVAKDFRLPSMLADAKEGDPFAIGIVFTHQVRPMSWFDFGGAMAHSHSNPPSASTHVLARNGCGVRRHRVLQGCPFRLGVNLYAHQGCGPRNAVANADASETARQTFAAAFLRFQMSFESPSAWAQSRCGLYPVGVRHGWRRPCPSLLLSNHWFWALPARL